jgi:hypothetical protein
MTKDELEVFARLSEKLSSSLKQQRIASHA